MIDIPGMLSRLQRLKFSITDFQESFYSLQPHSSQTLNFTLYSHHSSHWAAPAPVCNTPPAQDGDIDSDTTSPEFHPRV